MKGVYDMGKIRGWVLDTIYKFKVNDGTERTVFDEAGYLYQRGTKVTASAAELNAFAGVSAENVFISGSAGTATNGDIVIDIPFTPTDFIINGRAASGAPRTFDTATFAEGSLTIEVTTGAGTDRWSVIAWVTPSAE